MSNSGKKVILITGATDGLGKAIAERLVARGWRVLLHGRNAAKGGALCEALRERTGNHDVHYFNADLSSLKDTKDFAAAVLDAEPRLDVLVNNAGIGPISADAPRRESKDGHELFFAVNYLAGYLLTRELLPLLHRSAPARIINVASIGQQAIDFDDVMLTQDYDDMRAYRQSKLAQILFTFDLAEELQGSGVTVNCLHPATLMPTQMVNESQCFPGPVSTLEQGVEALDQLVSSQALSAVNGAYYDGKQQGRANDQAYDRQARLRLRNLSNALIADV